MQDPLLREQPNDNDIEEWVFSLLLPKTIASRSSSMELRHKQQKATHLPHYDHSSRRSENDDNVVVQNEEETTTTTPAAERESLLSITNNSQQQQQSPESSCWCWTFRSPYWSIASQQLLSITYSAAWQNLPEYTNSLLSSSACCGCGSSSVEDRIDIVTEQFFVDDIVAAERTQVDVDGRVHDGIRISLRPMEIKVDTTIPTYLQAAWNRRVGSRGGTTTTTSSSTATGPVIEICLATHLKDAPLLSRVHLPAVAEYAIAIRSITVLDGGFTNQHQETPAVEEQDPTHIYINGYQSWSFAGSVPRGFPQPKSRLPNMFSRAFNLGAKLPPHYYYRKKRKKAPPPPPHYTSDFFACISADGRVQANRFLRGSRQNKFPFQELDETGGPALLLGWLSQRQQFGLVTASKDLTTFQMHCSLDGQMLVAGDHHGTSVSLIHTDWAYIQLIHPHSYDEEPMAAYLCAVADYNTARPLMNGTLLTGWCSWYVFYEKINAGLLRDNCARLASMRSQLPTNVVVVDDGYMTAWGDWNALKPAAFTSMQSVARDIEAQNMRPGVWLAPFAADKGSRLAKEHPDWIIRNDAGQAANSSHCGKFFYGLDATNPAVLEHVRRTIQRATQEWGFNVLKIDFLYAACLDGNGKHNPTMSRAQTMHIALKTIRDAAGPDVFLIGCGCPLATGIGFIDAMRISADTGPTWYPSFPLPKYDNGTLPSLRAMIRNSISRAPLGHRWWHNDPDCIMLGKHTRLNDEEVASAATVVAMTCGMLLLSDDLPKVSARRLSIVAKIFPLTGITATVLDLHSTNDGLPSLMRLWCTDKYGALESFHESTTAGGDHNLEATHFARQSSISNDRSSRKRNCVHVARGLGTWTVLSVSNWSDKTAVIRVPPPALLPPPNEGWGVNEDSESPGVDSGFHVFSFWSSQYKWMSKVSHDDDPEPETITRKLRSHESEIYHIKRVTPNSPQYIGSDLHFTCGYEVRSFRIAHNKVTIMLRTSYKRSGSIFVYIPRVNVSDVVKVNNGFTVAGTVPRQGSVIGRILRIPVEINEQRGGNIVIDF